MTEGDFELTQQLLRERGLVIDEAIHHREAFDSWLVYVRSRPRLGVVWDGKDRWLYVRRETGKTSLWGTSVWEDVWVARESADQSAAAGVEQLVLSLGVPSGIDRAEIASDLEVLMSGELSASGFERRYGSSISHSALLSATWGNLEHYLSDGDIRDRDERYRRMQDGEMRSFVMLLRDGASLEQLSRISFLQSTGSS